jgi:hypothetical protein
MSETPETDEQACGTIGFYSCATVPADFARRLERERDEARLQYSTTLVFCQSLVKARLGEMEVAGE